MGVRYLEGYEGVFRYFGVSILPFWLSGLLHFQWFPYARECYIVEWWQGVLGGLWEFPLFSENMGLVVFIVA